MARLLFLIADTGGGHRASATAVARHLERERPGHEISIVDPFAEAAPRIIGGTASLYGPITRHARWLWGALYHATNSRLAVAALLRSVLRTLQPGIRGQLESFDPDVVVSFHPLLNHAAGRSSPSSQTSSTSTPRGRALTWTRWSCRRPVDSTAAGAQGSRRGAATTSACR